MTPTTTPTMLDAANTQAQATERRRRIRQSIGAGVLDLMTTPDLMAALARAIPAGEIAGVLELLGEVAARRQADHYPPGWQGVADACWDRLAAIDEEAG